MGLAIDAILLIVIGLCIYSGVKKGFVRTIMSLISSIIALVLALSFASPLSSHIEGTRAVQNIKQNVYTSISDFIKETGRGNIDELFDNNKNTDEKAPFSEIISKYGVNFEKVNEYYNSIENKASLSLEEKVTALSEKIANPIIKTISFTVAFLILYVSAMLILGISTLIIDSICKLPVLRTFNAVLGAVVGAVKALVFAWVLVIIIKISLPYLYTVNPGLFPLDLIEKTLLCKMLYYINIIKDVVLNGSILSVYFN